METNLILPVREAICLDESTHVETAPQEAASFKHILDEEIQQTSEEQRSKDENELMEELASMAIPIAVVPTPALQVDAPARDVDIPTVDVVADTPVESSSQNAEPLLIPPTDGLPAETPVLVEETQGDIITPAPSIDVVTVSDEPSIDVESVGLIEAEWIEESTNVEQPHRIAPGINQPPERDAMTVDTLPAEQVPDGDRSPSPVGDNTEPITNEPSNPTRIVEQAVDGEEPQLEAVASPASETDMHTPTGVVAPMEPEATSERTSTQTEPARLAEAQKPQVLRQISSGVRILQRSEQTSLKIQLHPESLGRIELQLISEGDGVRVNMIADAEPTSSMLQQHKHDLQQSLQHAGVQLLDLAVSHQGGQASTSTPQHAEPNQPGTQVEHAEPQNIPDGIFSDPDALVDVRI